jgi:serine/threonine-protein kinase
MLCGQPPFRSEGFGELAHLHLSATPVPPREHRPEIPEALSAVVLRALAKDPAERFASMVELGAALAPWSSEAPSLPSPARRRGGWLAALGGALLVIGGGAAALWSVRTPLPLAPAAAPVLPPEPMPIPTPIPTPVPTLTAPSPPAKSEAASAPLAKPRATIPRSRPQAAPPPRIVPGPSRRREPVPL